MPSRMTVHKWFLRMQYELSLRLVSGGEGLDKELTTPQVSRPGLTLAGYFRHFDPRQMQVLGQQEIAYVSDLAPARRSEIFRQMLDADMPCVVVTRGLEPPAELVEESRRAATALLSTNMSTGSFIARTIVYLEEEFGPSEVLHANLAEVYGVGVLIQGKSGIGKSECMLELVKRGHRFVADDSVAGWSPAFAARPTRSRSARASPMAPSPVPRRRRPRSTLASAVSQGRRRSV